MPDVRHLGADQLLLDPQLLIRSDGAPTELAAVAPTVQRLLIVRLLERFRAAGAYERRRLANQLVCALVVFGPFEHRELPDELWRVLEVATLPWCLTQARREVKTNEIQLSNHAMCDLVGVAGYGSLMARPFFEWLDGESQAFVRAQAAPAMNNGQAARLYSWRVLQHTTGRPVPVIHSVSVLLDGALRSYYFSVLLPAELLPAAWVAHVRALGGVMLGTRSYAEFQRAGELERRALRGITRRLLGRAAGPSHASAGGAAIERALQLGGLDTALLRVLRAAAAEP